MIRFYFHPTPNPAKVALFLEEAGLDYEIVPVDTSKGEQHLPAFRAVNPNGKVPAIVDTDGPGGTEARVFDSTAILLYLADKTGLFTGSPADRHELLSWLLFIASGLGPFSGQAVHFQYAAPEGNDYAVNRYRREAERHYQVLDDHLAEREAIVGGDYTIADMSAWGWIDRASRVLKGENDPLAAFPNIKRWFQTVDARPAAARARLVGQEHEFKKVRDEEALRALFSLKLRQERLTTARPKFRRPDDWSRPPLQEVGRMASASRRPCSEWDRVSSPYSAAAAGLNSG